MSDSETILVRAPLRVSLGGGGTDIPAYYERHGGLVLSAAITRYVYVIARPPHSRGIHLNSADYQCAASYRPGEIPDVEEPLAIHKAAVEWFSACGLRERGVDLFTASEVAPGTGLGSSSALAVGLIRGLAEYLQIETKPEELAEGACQLEIGRLAMPIGKQDQYASAFGGVNCIRFRAKGVTVDPLCLPDSVLADLDARLLLFSTGRTRRASSILKHQSRASGGNGAVVRSLHRIKELAGQMQEALRVHDLDEVGRLLDAAWREKKRLASGVSNPAIDGWYSAAREAGALGGKITGAGGGGFLLLYCPPERQPALRRAMAGQGLRELTFGFDFDGVTAGTVATLIRARI